MIMVIWQIRTKSGASYMTDGLHLSRISEVPIEHAEDVILNGTEVEFVVAPEVGLPLRYRVAGELITSTVVLQIWEVPL